MTSYNPGTVGGGTYQEMCGINYFWKEAFWPWLITWSRAGRQTGRGFPGMLPPPVAAEILCHPPSQEDGALVASSLPEGHRETSSSLDCHFTPGHKLLSASW